MPLKLFSGSVITDASLGPREIRVVANSGKSDRVKDVLVGKGCVLENYRANPIVLADHDPSKPVGNFAPEIIGEAVEGLLTFAPEGISAKADEYCGLYKAGVLRTVSVGFNALDCEPIEKGGYLYRKWELLELSCVAVPCDPGAVVTARSAFGERSLAKAETESWKCGASLNLPAGDDEAWDGSAAEASIFEHAGFDGDSPDLGFARKGFLAYESANPRLKGSYKLPFAKLSDGRLTAMPSGIRAAASRLSGTDVPAEVKSKARAALDHYEAKMGIGGDEGKERLAHDISLKGMWDVARLAALVEELGGVLDWTKMEAALEGDASPLPAMLAASLSGLAACLLAMTKEEIDELLAGHDIELDPPVDDDPLAKRFRAAVAKAGRMLSETNADHLDKAMKCFGKAAMKSGGLKSAHETVNGHVADAIEHLKNFNAPQPEPGALAGKCMKCLRKAENSMADASDLHDELAHHFGDAATHVKAVVDASAKKPHSENDDDSDEFDPDQELALAAEHRKRLAAVLALADAP
jgi:hypothetical protein